MESHTGNRRRDEAGPSASAPSPSTTRRGFVVGAGSVAGATTVAGLAAGQEDGDTVSVVVGPGGSLVFEPADLEIPPGTTVRFTWESDLHNVVVASQPEGADWPGTAGGEAETYDTGHEYTHTFETAGTYEYYCSPHRASGMTGSITVSEDATVPADAGAESVGDDGGGSSLLVTGLGIGLTAATVAAVYFYGWRSPPETETEALGDSGGGGAVRVHEDETTPELGTTHGGPMYEAEVDEREAGSVDHDAFDPVGTGTLLVGYFLLVALLWLFMYFVEFLGNGPKVVG